MDQAH